MGVQLKAIFSALTVCLFTAVSVETRQMCWSCQYVLRGTGMEECSAAPGNWSGGESRIKCPTMCIITAEFDAVTGEPTFIHRGCGLFMQKDGCLENGARHSCFYSCEGTNYCNGKKLRKSPKLVDTDGAGRLELNRKCLMYLLLSLLVYVLVHVVTVFNIV